MHKVISLFSGAGGLDIGLKTAGFDIVIAVENDSDSIQTLCNNWPQTIISKPSDITKLSAKSILKQADLDVGEPALVVGGPPCQPFSKSAFWVNGDSTRLLDERSKTINHFFRIVDGTLPIGIVFENVEGIRFSKKDEGVKLIQDELRKINERNSTNYIPNFFSINSADFGVPQTRQRFFMIANRDGNEFKVSEATHTGNLNTDDNQGDLLPYTTAWDAIGDLEFVENCKSIGLKGKWADLIPTIPEGHNYMWHTARGGGLPIFGWRTRYWSFLLKLQKSRPSWTLQASPGPSTGPFHWRNRRLSIREMCRLQTFPDNYNIYGNNLSATRQIGNAVPSAIGELLGKCIKIQFFDMPGDTRLSLIPSHKKSSPPPELCKGLPEKYLKLATCPPDHPGSGKGPRALGLLKS